jgi:hypothetical protein
MAGSERKSAAKWREDKCGDLAIARHEMAGRYYLECRRSAVLVLPLPPGGCHRSRGGDDDDNSTLDHDDPTHRRHSCMAITLIGVCVCGGGLSV